MWSTWGVHLRIKHQNEEQERVSLTQSYHHAFVGFSALLTEKEAALLSGHEDVISVFPDRVLELHTTRSWDFLNSESGLRSERLSKRASSDVIIGIVDTGIWPESPSFSDVGMTEVPTRWKGVCMEASDFKKTDCNRKLIGARFYSNQAESTQASPPSNKTTAVGSPRDSVGHGTHTASTAAGTAITDANYYGLAQGTAKGGSPSNRIAIYKACSLGGCSGSALLKAIDDAVNDGVDVISISIGMSSVFQADFLSDPISIGAFHANQRGVLVICSGGNDGPEPFTVVNTAPWIVTVVASSIDRSFQSNIQLGNGVVLKGSSINFSNLTSSVQYPLVLGSEVAAQYTPVAEASNCYPGSLDVDKTKGKIVVCVSTDSTVSRKVKRLVAEDARAKGLILIDESTKGVPFDSGNFAFSQVGSDAGSQILAYINSTKSATAVILPTADVKDFKPAPEVAYFSSRGPGGLSEGILKPDIMAPGVSILAASIPSTDAGTVPSGKKPSNFAIKSGTSMACPHVAGSAAFIKSAHRAWSPSMIRSALMTTALTNSNNGKPLTTSLGANANYHDTGAGEISPLRALSPGLVYETTPQDYLQFLCYYGYKEQLIRKVSGTNFSCSSAGPSPDLISNMNYPSISIPRLSKKKPVTVTRTLTNVGPHNSTYGATIEAPEGVSVNISPEKLIFGNRWLKASYQISFSDSGAPKGYSYGSVTWSDGAHSVRTGFAVNVL
ncbi:subtilisin-like protease isoform X2 [Carex littledalei]|uniref:Subtilisin-like protease isoform X2 n=1 Tax=Carex littledalei TaxID=544730 RepID=A0A833QY73_9POAL|nr:subtilisin-like protease isoform X2 [Carex littledalei]